VLFARLLLAHHRAISVKKLRGHGRQPVFRPLESKEPVSGSVSDISISRSNSSGGHRLKVGRGNLKGPTSPKTKNRKQRRQQHGSAWHWKQTDAWYHTEPGTKKRVSQFDENGERIRGKENKETARIALARIKVADELIAQSQQASGDWTVARVCDVYLADLHSTANPEWATQVDRWLNDLCGYCGALKVGEFLKRHL
jgi:hypothetical protein